SKAADRQDRLQRSFSRFRFLEGTWVYDWVLEARCYSAILEEMRDMSSSLPKDRRDMPLQIQAPFSARLSFLIHQTRNAFDGASAVVAVMMLSVIYSFGMWSARAINKSLKDRYGQSVSTAVPSPSPTPNPNNDLFTRSEKIFFVEKEGGYEKW